MSAPQNDPSPNSDSEEIKLIPSVTAYLNKKFLQAEKTPIWQERIRALQIQASEFKEHIAYDQSNIRRIKKEINELMEQHSDRTA